MHLDRLVDQGYGWAERGVVMDLIPKALIQQPFLLPSVALFFFLEYLVFLTDSTDY